MSPGRPEAEGAAVGEAERSPEDAWWAKRPLPASRILHPRVQVVARLVFSVAGA